MGMDIGAVTPFSHAFREREKINDLLEELCGARLTYNYMRIGGVAWDLPPGFGEQGRSTSSTTSSRCIDEYERPDLVQQDLRRALRRRRGRSPPRWRSTTTWSARTCAARGVQLRRAHATSRTRSTPSSSSTCRSAPARSARVGDCYDRYMVRIREMQGVAARSCASAVEADAGRAGDRQGAAQVQAAGRATPTSASRAARGDMGWYVGQRRHRVSRTASTSAPARSPPWRSSTTSARA